MTPTQRSLKYLRELGYTCAIVERWNPHARVRQDLFGFIDLVAMRAGESIIGIQTTSTRVAERVAKIDASDDARTWLRAGGRIHVHGWRKVKAKRGGRRMVWRMRLVEIRLAHDDTLICKEVP